MRNRWMAGALALTIAAPAFAQPATIDARTAQAIVAGCAAHATGKKQSHAIAVVDSGGHLVAALRMDGNGSGIGLFGRQGQGGRRVGLLDRANATGARETPGFGQAPSGVTVAGGVPIYSADGKSRLGGGWSFRRGARGRRGLRGGGDYRRGLAAKPRLSSLGCGILNEPQQRPVQVDQIGDAHPRGFDARRNDTWNAGARFGHAGCAAHGVK